MNKLIATFMLLFLVNAVLGAIMEGGGGIASTRLTVALSPVATTINVANTEGFLESDYIRLDDELIRYTSKTANTFTAPANGRGFDNTEAVAHASNTRVYSPDSSVINSALGFNIASTGATVGVMSIPTALYSFFFITLPKLVTWDFAHFRVSEWTQMLRYVFLAISTGFSIYIAFHIAATLGGILQSIFTRA